MYLSIPDFIGRFHPVLVHLPIGILLLACFFQLFALKDRFAMLQPVIPAMLFWGMLGAISSCITGYMLSLSGDYDGVLVNRHQWLGIGTAIVATVLYVLYRFSISKRIAGYISAGIIILISITGHLGGSLTHGSDYLASGLSSGNEKAVTTNPIPNIQEAVLYTDVVQPMLQAKCYSCHGPDKQKGKLRLDKEEYILKGGKEGKALEPGKADSSSMIERMLLPLTNEDHMPPKEKKQLTAGEISLLHWWISTGANFNKKVKDLAQTDQVKPVLLAFQSGSSTGESKLAEVPEEPVAKGDEVIISRLKNAGVMIIPVAQNSNYLSASFFTVGAGADSLVKLLGSLKNQIIWLKLDKAAITDATMDHIGKLTMLKRLQLSNTIISDTGLAKINSLKELQFLNLVGTRVTAKGVSTLSLLKNLKQLYLYRTGVVNTDWPMLKKTLPATQMDSGKYAVSFLATDTMVVN